MAVTAKECHVLITYFENAFKDKYGRAPNINRYAARWGFDSILQSMKSDEARALIDYYFTTPPTRNHDLDWFFYNYHKIIEAMQKSTDDAEHRRKLMRESKERAERWRQSGKQSITDD